MVQRPIVMHAVIASGQTQEGTWSPMAKGSEEGCGFCRAVMGDAWVWQDCRDAYFELGSLTLSKLIQTWWVSGNTQRLHTYSCAGGG